MLSAILKMAEVLHSRSLKSISDSFSGGKTGQNAAQSVHRVKQRKGEIEKIQSAKVSPADANILGGDAKLKLSIILFYLIFLFSCEKLRDKCGISVQG